MIKRLRVRNFKSLLDTAADLEKLTVLIGPTGAGKSNFVSAVRVLSLLINQADGLTSFSESGLTVMGPVKYAGSQVQASWEIEFTEPNSNREYIYRLTVEIDENRAIKRIASEELTADGEVVFKWENNKWLTLHLENQIPGINGSRSMFAALANKLREVGRPFELISGEIRCYRIADDVFTQNQSRTGEYRGKMDYSGFGALTLVPGVQTNELVPQIWDKIAEAMKCVTPNAAAIEELFESEFHFGRGGSPANNRAIPLGEWSEGFRRLLATLIAIYQNPPKMTICLDTPELGLSYRAQMVLADHLLSANIKLGVQFIITTQSPLFLDRFPPESIRLVEIGDDGTHVKSPSEDDFIALRDKLMTSGELLTM